MGNITVNKQSQVTCKYIHWSSSSPPHLPSSLRAGKAVLCEKPIDLDIAKVNRCLDSLKKRPVPLLVGFNRRFDPSAEALKRAIVAGEIGQVRQVIISSRDPGLLRSHREHRDEHDQLLVRLLRARR